MESPTRHLEVFSAGCPVCVDAFALVQRLSGDGCNVRVLDMNDPAVVGRARKLGARSVPAVLIDGVLAACCAGRGPDEVALRAAGLGTTE